MANDLVTEDVRTVRTYDVEGLSAEDAEAANALGIVLAGSALDAINRAVAAQNAALRLVLEAGYLLLKAKGELKHGEFVQHTEACGLSRQRASELMAVARFFTTTPPQQRPMLAGLGKSKLLALADADEAVIEDILSDPAGDLETLSVRALRQRIKSHEERLNALQTDLNTANDRLKTADKVLPPPFLSREADAQMQRMLSHEAMGAAGLDLLTRMLPDLASSGEHLPERMLTMHSCLTALLSRVTIALAELDGVAGEHDVVLPERPQMVLSEDLARDYLAAHTGYIETAIELAQKALIGRADVLGRGRGRPVGSGKKTGKKA